MFKNGVAGFARGEDGEDAHAAVTGVANQDIDGKHALEQVGLGEPTARDMMGLIGSGSGSVHDRGAEVVVGREHAVVASEMTARWWDQGRQAAEEIERMRMRIALDMVRSTARMTADRAKPSAIRFLHAPPPGTVLDAYRTLVGIAPVFGHARCELVYASTVRELSVPLRSRHSPPRSRRSSTPCSRRSSAARRCRRACVPRSGTSSCVAS